MTRASDRMTQPTNPTTKAEIETRIGDAHAEREVTKPRCWQPWRNAALDNIRSGRVDPSKINIRREIWEE